MKLEHLPSVNLVWHDPKLQHGNMDAVGIEEPFRLNVVCPLRIPPSRKQMKAKQMSDGIERILIPRTFILSWLRPVCQYNFRAVSIVFKHCTKPEK